MSTDLTFSYSLEGSEVELTRASNRKLGFIVQTHTGNRSSEKFCQRIVFCSCIPLIQIWRVFMWPHVKDLPQLAKVVLGCLSGKCRDKCYLKCNSNWPKTKIFFKSCYFLRWFCLCRNWRGFLRESSQMNLGIVVILQYIMGVK